MDTKDNEMVFELCEDQTGPKLTEKIEVPSFEENRKAYKHFIFTHALLLNDGATRNADILIAWARGDVNDTSFPYGNSGHLEECVANVLKNYKIACEFIPAGFEEIGLSDPGQTKDYILVEKSAASLPNLESLKAGRLDW